MPVPSICTWLAAELDKRLEREPTDRAREVFLAKTYGFWSAAFADWQCRGVQPFGGPHPIYGEMDAFDFRLTLTMIDAARSKLARKAVLA